MNIFKINTTAFDEEDFYILTDLQKDQVHTTLRKFVLAKRNNDEDYNNKDLIDCINVAHPYAHIECLNEINTISI